MVSIIPCSVIPVAGSANYYRAFDPRTGRAVRATYILDAAGCLQYFVHSHRNVGRSVEETLRVAQALLTGRQCPADWHPGEATADSEKSP